ncbi:MAG: FAD-dependent oxidoreductase [Ignavibacteria bacterium]
MSKKHLIVIGAGHGGYAAAFLAADLGIKTTLIDTEDNPGGSACTKGAYLQNLYCTLRKSDF